MVGILIVTHGTLAQSLLETATLLTGEPARVLALGLERGQSIDQFTEVVRTTALGLDSGDGVVMLADLPGGSPCRAAALFMAQHPRAEVIAGVNLPMLVEGLMIREGLAPRELADRLLEGGMAGIVDIRTTLREI